MATYLQIFFRPLRGQGLDEVVSEVSKFVGVKLVSGPEIYDGRAYVGTVGGEIAAELFLDNDFLEDMQGMPFSSHPYQLEFRKIGIPLERVREFLVEVYERMKESDRYSLFATYDLQYALKSDICD